MVKKRSGPKRFFLMRTGNPVPLHLCEVEVLWQSLQTKRLDAVRDLLGRSGAILEVEGGGRKLCLKRLRELWLDHRVVSHKENAAGNHTSCSCWRYRIYRRRGHCPHWYGVRQHVGVETWVPETLPRAAEAPRDFRAEGELSDGSSVAIRRRPAVRRKKRRPEYRPPLPVPEDEPSEPLPAAPAARKFRVLPPQRASKPPLLGFFGSWGSLVGWFLRFPWSGSLGFLCVVASPAVLMALAVLYNTKTQHGILDVIFATRSGLYRANILIFSCAEPSVEAHLADANRCKLVFIYILRLILQPRTCFHILLRLIFSQ